MADGAPDQRDPHAVGVYLSHVTPTEIRPAESIAAEFKVLNAGAKLTGRTDCCAVDFITKDRCRWVGGR